MVKQWATVYKKGVLLPWEKENATKAKQGIIDKLLQEYEIGEFGLEVACGRGEEIKYLSEKGKILCGIDLSESAVALSESPNIIRGNILDMPFKADEFDFIIDLLGFHHLKRKDRQRYLSEVNRVLKKKGFYAMCSFNTDDAFYNPKRWCISRCGFYMNFSTGEEIKTLFSKKFTILELDNISWPISVGKHNASYIICQKT